MVVTVIAPVMAQTTVVRAARMVDVVAGRLVAPAAVVVEGAVTVAPGFHAGTLGRYKAPR